jgi:indolepyruvate ferredoxin oxidoreductase alpha subunit
MERSFKKEVELLRLGDGQVFEGEGILAISKALLQSGVSYVAGYQGSPVSQMVDVFNDAQDLFKELGVHFQVSPNEAAAAAALSASINYPLRGAAVWKSTVGTNVASDALSNLASSGVTGGALVILGEDYGEGASIIQERSHAFAMKSQMWLMDPRPDHSRMVDLIEKGFELSEVSNTPVMVEFRIRTSHMHGHFIAKTNKKPPYSPANPLKESRFDLAKIALPPSTFAQEKHKIEKRFPAALDFILANKLNDHFDGKLDDIGVICQGGLFNTLQRSLQQVGLADAFGQTEVPTLVLNVTYPLVPSEISAFCAGKRTVLVVEEGQPNFIEQAVESILRKADLQTKVVGKGPLPMAGEYTADVMLNGVVKFLEGAVPQGLGANRMTDILRTLEGVNSAKSKAVQLIGPPVPKRPPGFCVGCPERPIFSAMKLAQRTEGKFHVSSDIGCHTFSTLPPFNIGNTVMGFGLGLASSTGIANAFGEKRVVSVMGDGGFWHNGLTSGVQGSMFNKTDSVLVIVENGYTSATGQQYLPSSTAGGKREADLTIEQALKNFGVKWIRPIRSYSVGTMVKTLKEALNTAEGGLKVIIAQGECMLAKQRRLRAENKVKLDAGQRVIRTRFGIDDGVCTGDHSCIRLSGCPSLTVKDNPDPFRRDPVASVNNECVGCGLCGEVADAAVLCPSFFKADIVQNPTWWDKLMWKVRQALVPALRVA